MIFSRPISKLRSADILNGSVRGHNQGHVLAAVNDAEMVEDTLHRKTSPNEQTKKSAKKGVQEMSKEPREEAQQIVI